MNGKPHHNISPIPGAPPIVRNGNTADQMEDSLDDIERQIQLIESAHANLNNQG